MNFICIDKRKRDAQNNQTFIYLENGKHVLLPPNIHSVPALLMPNQNYRVIFGDELILQYFEPLVSKQNVDATTHISSSSSSFETGMGEPLGVSLQLSNNGMSIVSEKFTLYDMSPDDLGAKGNGGKRNMYSYYPATHDITYKQIETPVDSYRPDKLGSSVTIDSLEQQRYKEIPSEQQPKHIL